MSNQTHVEADGIVTGMNIEDLRVDGGFSVVEYIIDADTIWPDGSVTHERVRITDRRDAMKLGDVVRVRIPIPQRTEVIPKTLA